MKKESNILSSFVPKDPGEALKQKVLKAATGAAEEPVTYMPLLRKLDWGLLAASLILAATLALINRSDSQEHGPARSPELSAAGTSSIKELDIPGIPRCPARSEIAGTAELMKDFGG